MNTQENNTAIDHLNYMIDQRDGTIKELLGVIKSIDTWFKQLGDVEGGEIYLPDTHPAMIARKAINNARGE